MSARTPTKTERRGSARDTLEHVLDRFLRPRNWAARLALRTRLQSEKIHVDRLSIAADRPAGAPPLRIAFASDFHAGATTDRRVLEAAFDAIARENPDLLLLGGDFVTTRAGYIDQLAPLIAGLNPPLGKIGVFGNHDRRANRNVLTKYLEPAGVRMLVNEVITLPAPHADVSIIGLDDPIIGDPQWVDAPSGGVRIVLMHAPDGLLTLGDESFDLALAGHTHGGQITFGKVKPYLPHGRLSRQYAAGLYRTDSGSLLVSQGVGCSTVPVRLGSCAQVHVVTIG